MISVQELLSEFHREGLGPCSITEELMEAFDEMILIAQRSGPKDATARETGIMGMMIMWEVFSRCEQSRHNRN